MSDKQDVWLWLRERRQQLCQEATEDVSYDEHVRHVDFIALTSRAAGYHTPSPPPDEWKRRYDLLRK